MSKPEAITVSILSQHNGLVHVLLFVGPQSRKQLVVRTNWTYDPEEGTPTYRRILEESIGHALLSLDGR